MKKNNYYRIELCEGSTSLCNSLISIAAQSNGGAKEITLQQLKGIAESETILYPSINEGTTAELIGENVLHIDRKIGEEYKTVCRIEQVEILELAKVVEMENDEDLSDIANQ